MSKKLPPAVRSSAALFPPPRPPRPVLRCPITDCPAVPLHLPETSQRRPPPVARNASLAWPVALAAVVCVALLIAGAGPRVRGLLGATGWAVAGSLALAVPLGGWLGVCIAKTRAPGRRVAVWLLAAQVFLPLYVHAAAWKAAFGQLGWWTQGTAGAGPVDPLLAGLPGVAWVHGLAAAPWVALITAAALATVDRSQEEAASLDAGPLAVLLRITLRYAGAGAAAAALWCAVLVAGEMTVTDLLRVRTFAEEVYTQAASGLFDRGSGGYSNGSSGGAGRLPAWPLVCGVAVLTLGGAAAMGIMRGWLLGVGGFRFGGRGGTQTTTQAEERPAGTPAWRLPATGFAPAAALWAPMLLLVAAPVANLACQAGVTVERQDDGWRRGWSASRLASEVVTAPWRQRRELAVTAQLGLGVATVATLLGGAVAWWLCRSGASRTPQRRSWAQRESDPPEPSRTSPPRPLSSPAPPPPLSGSFRPRSVAPWAALLCLSACMVAPGPLLGVGVIRLLNHPWDSPLAGLTWLYDHTLLAPALAQLVRATPGVVLILWPALDSVPAGLLAAARSDGASRLGALVWVAAPVRWRAIAVAWLAALAVSVAELPATLLTMPPGPSTLTVRVFSLLHYGVDGRVAGICLCMLGGFTALAAAA
ncbi:MAG: hypothetical protein AAF790_12300, partial [Planctomycetota bacterium]